MTIRSNKQLIENTQKAVDAGVFGVPTFILMKRYFLEKKLSEKSQIFYKVIKLFDKKLSNLFIDEDYD